MTNDQEAAAAAVRERVARGPGRRARVLRHGPFRRYALGQTTSLLGSGMNTVGTSFAVLQMPGGGADTVGAVMAVRIAAVLAVLLAGGVLVDRLGARVVMWAAEVSRCAAQAVLAVLLLTGTAQLWEVVVLAVVLGVGEGGFGAGPAALVPGLVPEGEIADANALLQVGQGIASVAGPGLAGLLIALWDPGVVVAVDAASYAVSALALVGLTLPVPAAAARGGWLTDLRHGWGAFVSRAWLWVTTAHFALFNLLLWAPFLVLGPVVAQRRLGGAGGWGVVLAVYGAGSAFGGAALLGRAPRRALAWSVAASAGWALPAAALALRAPMAWVAVAAGVAGACGAACGTLHATALQRGVPAHLRGRIGAFDGLGAFALGPLGLALAGPVAGAVGGARGGAEAGAPVVLGWGVLWQLTAVALVLGVPSVRRAGAEAG
ncbi:MFS transporter [Streptomyces sp. NPDC057963]|uniref:MFS transporter n=1 Tax=Streptomyces sp. NPDC057963 TaxID=3346290 RepID=UPI0036E960A4